MLGDWIDDNHVGSRCWPGKKSGRKVRAGLGTLEGWDLFRARLGLVEKMQLTDSRTTPHVRHTKKQRGREERERAS